MLSVKSYAEAAGLSPRQVQRYLAEGRLAGATKVAGSWSIPSDVRPTEATSYDVVPVTPPTGTSYDVAAGVAIPPGLWPLQECAELLGTTVGGVRRLGDAGLLNVGPYGRDGALRVFVAPR